MNDNSKSPLMEKISGAVSDGLSNALERQSPALAAANKYQERFLSKNRIRSNCRVYISGEMCALLGRIVSAVGADKASVGAYVTEIVRDHIESNRDSINAIYLTHTQPLF